MKAFLVTLPALKRTVNIKMIKWLNWTCTSSLCPCPRFPDTLSGLQRKTRSCNQGPAFHRRPSSLHSTNNQTQGYLQFYIHYSKLQCFLCLCSCINFTAQHDRLLYLASVDHNRRRFRLRHEHRRRRGEHHLVHVRQTNGRTKLQ